MPVDAPERPDTETSDDSQGASGDDLQDLFNLDGGAENQEAHHKYMQGIREAEQKGNANENGDVDGQKARENETEGTAASTPKGGWDDKTGSGPTDSSKFNKAFAFAKKRGGVIGLMAIFGVGGGIMAAILAPPSMFMSVLQGIVDTNDTSSPVVNRRFAKTMQNMMSGADQLCESSLKIRCRMGKVSNSALSRLYSNDITAVFADGSLYDGSNTKGYPKSNPAKYSVYLGEGKIVLIDAKNLMAELSKRENAKIAAKVLGRGGAFNLKVRAWSGKYLAYRLYDKFGLLRNGGIADGKSDSDGDASKSRLDKALAKLRERIPGINQYDDFKDKFTLNIDNKVRDNLRKVSKAGIGYTVAVTGCIAVKAPRIVAAAVAAVEVLRITGITMDLVLSPVSKMMGGGVDTANSLTPEDSETLGTIYTSTSIDDTGKSSSMLDSPILQAAMGINTNKVVVSQKFTPGLSYLTNPIVTTTGAIADKTSDSCSYIMSPAAMYTAMAIDAAGTVAASTTGVGLVVKLVGSYLASSLASWAIEQVVASYSEQALAALLDDDKLASAVGKDLGDIVGIGAFAFFSSGGMARGLPTLKRKQIFSLAAMQKEMEEQQKNMDIATLSPFDTSSKYTFLGSIVNNARMAALDSGFSTNSLASIFGNIFRMPAYSLSPNAGATAIINEISCGYAEEFGLAVNGNDGETPSINASGLPCTGLTIEQADMSTEAAISALSSAGWIDESIDVAEEANIDDLLSTGFIVQDSPMADFITSCTHAENGEYLFNAGSCTVDSETSTANIGNVDLRCTDEAGNDVACGELDTTGVDFSEGASNAYLAMSVFLIDYQIEQSVNGHDDEFSTDTAVSGYYDDSVAFYQATTTDANDTEVVDSQSIASENWIIDRVVAESEFDIVMDEVQNKQAKETAIDKSQLQTILSSTVTASDRLWKRSQLEWTTA